MTGVLTVMSEKASPKKDKKIISGLGLKYKIALLFSALIILTVGIVTLITIVREVSDKKDDADVRMANTAATIKLGMDILPPDRLDEWVNSLYSIRFDTKSYNLDLVYVLIEGRDGERILSSMNPRARVEGSPLGTLEPHELRDKKIKGLRKVEAEITDSETGAVKSKISLGYYLLNLNRGIIKTVIEALLITSVLVIFAVMLSFFFSDRIVRPLHSLVAGMEAVAGGNFEEKIPVRTTDEIGFLTTSFNRMTEGLKEREFIKDTFKRYVTREVADKILSQRDDIVLSGERRNVTVLFADIKGFTPMAESTPPVELVSTLNDYFSAMIDVIFKYEGVLDKFIGDAIMAFWNAPLDQDHPGLRAVAAALEMRKSLVALNQKRGEQGKSPIHMGIGINTGEAVAGTIGSEKKMEYTVIGDTVNVAQRLESITQKGQILISESTYRMAAKRLVVHELPPQSLKGVQRPIKIFEVEKIIRSGEKR
jgi:class 3 adenylate cyclase